MRISRLPISDPPFITAETLLLLYPELEPLLVTVPSHLENTVRVYNAFVALDVLNTLRKPVASQVDETALPQKSELKKQRF